MLTLEQLPYSDVVRGGGGPDCTTHESIDFVDVLPQYSPGLRVGQFKIL